MRIAIVAVLLAASVARADEYSDHLEQGAVHLSTDELNLALIDYKAAYQLHQTPSLLLMVARIERRLGHVEQAIDYFRRWLASDDVDNAISRPEAEAAVAALEKLRPPPVSLPAAALASPWALRPVRMEKRPVGGLIAGGSVLFALSYGAAAMTGVAMMTLNTGNNNGYYSGDGYTYSPDPNGNISVGGGLLLIPFLGPFLTSAGYHETSWAVSWALIDGPAQIAGLVMMIMGRRVTRDVPIFSKVQLAPMATANTAGLSLSGRF